MVGLRYLTLLETALKYALEYEARHHSNPHFPMNNSQKNRYSTTNAGLRDRSPSLNVRFTSSPDWYKTVDSRQGLAGIIGWSTGPEVLNYPNNCEPPFQYPPYLPYQPYPYYPGSPMSKNSYLNPNYPYTRTNTPPRAQSPAVISNDNLNFDSAHWTDAWTGTEKTVRLVWDFSRNKKNSVHQTQSRIPSSKIFIAKPSTLRSKIFCRHKCGHKYYQTLQYKSQLLVDGNEAI